MQLADPLSHASHIMLMSCLPQDVGLAGWSTGGGHGWLSSEFGMGADNTLQATVVLPSGEIVTANECQNTDLLWAIRGGGGGTFGVITKLTVKAHPMPQATTWSLSMAKISNDTSAWWKLLARIHAELPALKAGGLQGYYTIAGPPSTSTLTFGWTFNLYNKSNGTLENLIKPVLSLLEKEKRSVTYTSEIKWFSTWYEAFTAAGSQEYSAGLGGVASTSRLLPAASLTENLESLANVLEVVGPQENPKVSHSLSLMT